MPCRWFFCIEPPIEPLDVDPVREAHYHRRAVEQCVRSTLKSVGMRPYCSNRLAQPLASLSDSSFIP